MKQTFLLAVILAFSILTGSAQTNGSKKQETDKPQINLSESSTLSNDDHTQWISKSLKKIEQIKVGMTRADLLKTFETEGGLFTNSKRTFVFRESPYIKVDVEFKTVGETTKDKDGRVQINVEHNADIITKISKPYLGWTILD